MESEIHISSKDATTVMLHTVWQKFLTDDKFDEL